MQFTGILTEYSRNLMKTMRRLSATFLVNRRSQAFYPLFAAVILFFSLSSQALPVKISHNDLQLNANYIKAENKHSPFLLILHGTFAWQGMELPSSLQSLLAEQEIGSLAITLSLNEDNRQGFFDCSHPILSKHQDAQGELLAWIKHLNTMGYTNISLVGHSRGGAQVAQFALDHPDMIKQAFLIAPMVWQQETASKSFNQQNKQPLSKWLDKAQSQPDSLITTNRVLYCDNAKISLSSLASYYSAEPEKNTPSIIKNIKLPTHIYLGTEDPMITESFEAQKSLFQKNKRVRLRLIEDADHYFRDFAAEDIIDDILQQLEVE